MENFIPKKSKESNIIKSIRFSEELNNKITKVVKISNGNNSVKNYSFNGFVCSACEYALEHLPDEIKKELEKE